MDELLGRLVAGVGIDRATAETAVAIIITFLIKEGPAEQVRALIASVPGCEAFLAQHADAGTAGLSIGGIMGAGTKLMAAGLSMGQVQAVTQEVIAFSREKAGDEVVGQIVGSIPGLSQFV